MNKAILVFIGFLLIPLVSPESDGDCLNQGRRRVSADPPNCEGLTTSRSGLKCIYDSQLGRCDEISECAYYSPNRRRRLETEIDENFCSEQGTSRESNMCVYEGGYCHEVSECRGEYFYHEDSRRLSSDPTSETCSTLKTLDDRIFKCVVYEEKHSCEDKPKSCKEAGQYYSDFQNINGLKCENLEVSDSKYKCVLNTEKNICEEVKNASTTIKLSLMILFGLFFLF